MGQAPREHVRAADAVVVGGLHGGGGAVGALVVGGRRGRGLPLLFLFVLRGQRRVSGASMA